MSGKTEFGTKAQLQSANTVVPKGVVDNIVERFSTINQSHIRECMEDEVFQCIYGLMGLVSIFVPLHCYSALSSLFAGCCRRWNG
jgi:hypothetical protein